MSNRSQPLSPLTVNPFRKRDLAALALVLSVAAIMRWGYLGITEFKYDEAILALMSQAVATGQQAPLLGMQSSAGVANSPASVYMLAIPYLISSDPLFAVFFVASLNVLGVGLLWTIAHRYVNRVAALAAGLIYALNPWAILFSRKLWAQDIHTPLILLAIFLGLYGFAERKFWAQVLSLPVLLFGLQIHYGAWGLLPLYGWLLWLGRCGVDWRAAALSVMASVGVMTPFALGLADHGDLAYLASYAGGVSSGLTLIWDRAVVPVSQLGVGMGLETWLLPGRPDIVRAALPHPVNLTEAALASLILLGILELWRLNKHVAILFYLWIALPVIAFSLDWLPINIHYFIPLIPAMAALAGAGVRRLAALRAPLGWMVAPLLAAVLITQAVWWNKLLVYVEHQYTDGFQVPLSYYRPIRSELADMNDVLILNESAWTWRALLGPRVWCVRELATAFDGGLIVLPGHPFAVVQPIENGLIPGGVYNRGDIQVFPILPPSRAYAVGKFAQPLDYQDIPITPLDPVSFDTHSTLTGYAIDQGHIVFRWLLAGRNPISYNFFIHYLDANGNKIGQFDSLFWPGDYWCADDQILIWANQPVPDGTRIVRTGFYRMENGSIIGSNVVDAAGNPAAPWVDIPIAR